mmetsp:Transcript_44766/g.97834  ORF Transcript_44766/g.97834 Transcript_44766/m.97834 type:complete len:107 (-) Transcript_44766:386-706(-)|eukprot:CAMPEP_0116906410 /NCGR_PEP_ID=MMETSP0467-20121206/12509_1 /TAXON_ID=283647 /ORGANISM="Mesodinium pulex, Strain SPMC105" /LENGTH=106 /DNA_ID=CAMNT_0004581263 /DNA_START=811 /DNA_END=1131 /DNA_ORIENTATION=-
MELAKKLAEENKALGSNLGDDELIKTDMRFNYTKMVIPEFVCSSICAGLNLDDIVSGESDIEDPEDFNGTDSNLFKTEEEYNIHAGRKGYDKRLERPPSPPLGFKN